MVEFDWTISMYMIGKERPDLKSMENKAKVLTSNFNLSKADLQADVPNIINVRDFKGLDTNSEKIIKMTKSKYKNRFKEKGELKIGTHKFYQTHTNPEVRDEAEANTLLIGLGSNYDITAIVSGGERNRLFCCYDGVPDPKVLEDFEYDSYYTIEDIEGFSNAISKHLKSYYSKYSKCLYSHFKAIYGELPSSYNPSIINHRVMNFIGAEKYFLKNSHFHHQNEFRFLWMSPTNCSGSEVIFCKEAVDFCSFD